MLDNSAFTKLKLKYREQIQALDEQASTLDHSKNIRVDVIQQVLAMIRNIGHSYKSASPELKRLYLGLFWDKFEVCDRVITRSVHSTALLAVGAISEQKPTMTSPAGVTAGDVVQLRTIWGDRWDLGQALGSAPSRRSSA